MTPASLTVDHDLAEDLTKQKRIGREKRRLAKLTIVPRPLTWPKGDKLLAMEIWASELLKADPPLTRTAIKVGWAMSFAFNGADGRCFSKRKTLAEFTGLSEMSVKDALRELDERRFIVRRNECIRGKKMTVSYPSTPVHEGGLSTLMGGGTSTRVGVDCPPPCIPDLSMSRSMNLYPEGTEHYPSRVVGPPRKEDLAEPESEALYDDSDIPF